VKAALGSLPVEEMTLAEMAASLNGAGIKTLNGKSWTNEALRKFLKGA
jgi:hypothetical protein